MSIGFMWFCVVVVGVVLFGIPGSLDHHIED